MVLRVRTDSRTELFTHVLQATLFTLICHRRMMRAKELRGEFALVEIQSQIALSCYHKAYWRP